MKVDIAGKVRNTVLPRSKPLLPVFEAVVNSLQALEELPSISGFPTSTSSRSGNQRFTMSRGPERFTRSL